MNCFSGYYIGIGERGNRFFITLVVSEVQIVIKSISHYIRLRVVFGIFTTFRKSNRCQNLLAISVIAVEGIFGFGYDFIFVNQQDIAV